MAKEQVCLRLSDTELLVVDYDIDTTTDVSSKIARISTEYNCVPISATIVQGGNVVTLNKDTVTALSKAFKDIESTKRTLSIDLNV